MPETTRELWERQRRSVGDRLSLFQGVATVVEATTVLYAGSYVDLTPSFVWPSVTYVDLDRRAARFFADTDGLGELLAEHGADTDDHAVRFHHADYREPLAMADESVDLLISLYAGFVSEACTRYLRVGGHLLVNPSHGDAAMASIDARYRLAAVVTGRTGRYRVGTEQLDTHLVPKRPIEVTVEHLHRTGRAVGYTRSAFAYLFRRVA